MKKYGYDHYMRTHRAVDYHSLLAAVEASMESDFRYRSKEYFDRYSDEFNRLSNLSGYIYSDLQHIPHILAEHLPQRRCKFYDDNFIGSGIIWFNYATAWLPDSNLYTALENEEEYDLVPYDNPNKIWDVDYKVRKQRQNVVERLPKDQLLMLLLSVCGIITKVAELREGMKALAGLVDELEVLQNVIVKDDGTVVYHPAAEL